MFFRRLSAVLFVRLPRHSSVGANLAGLAALALLLLCIEPCRAVEVVLSGTQSASQIQSPAPVAEQPIESKPNSIFVFGGRLSTTDIYSTMLLNTNRDNRPIKYDNSIAGGAYRRDWWSAAGFVVGGEIGIADRFGYFLVCCDTVVKSSSLLNSGELWGGFSFRYQSPLLFDSFRIIPGFVVGLSATTDSIGREREREIGYHGNARLLGYVGAELAFSTSDLPIELVFRLHHRSGANGTFGHIMEGYNANVVGLRYRY